MDHALTYCASDQCQGCKNLNAHRQRLDHHLQHVAQLHISVSRKSVHRLCMYEVRMLALQQSDTHPRTDY
jgi:hypothetical protein